MSIILNALKKSEAQRRLGKAPTLAETAAITTAEELPRRRTWPWLVLVLAVLLTAGWFARDMLPRGAGNAEQPVSSTPLEEPVEQAPVSPQAVENNQPARESLEDIAGEAREQFYNPKPASPDRSSTSSTKSEFSTPVATYSAPPAADPGDTSTSIRAADSAPPGGSGFLGGRPEPAQAHPQVGTEPLTIYEIPREIRRNLPEIRITLQVYAEEPENRFAQVNGLRMVEGNELAAGLVLVEIRKRGLVFSYRDYRFIVGN